MTQATDTKFESLTVYLGVAYAIAPNCSSFFCKQRKTFAKLQNEFLSLSHLFLSESVDFLTELILAKGQHMLYFSHLLLQLLYLVIFFGSGKLGVCLQLFYLLLQPKLFNYDRLAAKERFKGSHHNLLILCCSRVDFL